MKLFAGFLLGLGTAWAALAIWQRLPEFPDIDEMDDIDRIVYLGESPEEALHRTGERDDVHLRQKFPPPPVYDPAVFTHAPRPYGV